MLSDAWFDATLYPYKFSGDFCLAASTPLLIYRLRRNGASGISVETQILRFIMFVTRYLDLFMYRQITFEYDTCMKIALMATTFHMIISLIFYHKAYRLDEAGIYSLALPLLFTMSFAPLFYSSTFFEVSSGFSQVLGIVANIPQFMQLLNPENRDWKMNMYLVLIAGYRAFYIPHWVLKYSEQEIWDIGAVMAGIAEAAILIVTFMAILLNRCKGPRAEIESLEDGAPKTPLKPAVLVVGQTKMDIPPRENPS